MKKNFILTFPVLLALFISGCGKKEGNQMGMFPVNAVVAEVELRTVTNSIELVATLESPDQMMIVSELNVPVREIIFSEGQHVKKNDILFRLDDVQVNARLAEAKANYGIAKLSFDRNKELLKNETVSQQEYDQAESTYKHRNATLAITKDEKRKTLIRASFDGKIGERKVSEGEFVTRGQPLAELIRMHPLEISFGVPERFLGALNKGLVVQFSTDAFSRETFEGKVIYISPSVDEKSRTVRVKASLPNEDLRLKPGMFGRLELALSRRENALLIPEACVSFQGNSSTVIAVDKQGAAVFKPVEIGQRFKGVVEILKGLTAHEIVVVEGGQKMVTGSPVIASPKSMAYGIQPGPLNAEK